MVEWSKMLESWTFEIQILKLVVCLQNRTEQNSIFIILRPHTRHRDTMWTAKCNLQRTWYFFFSSKYKAVIQIGTLGCSHSLVSVVLFVERGGVGGGGQPPYSQCYSLSIVSSSCITRKFVVRFVFCQKKIIKKNNLNLNGQLSQSELKINQRNYHYLPNSAFWGWLSIESQPQNPEFRNNPENVHRYKWVNLWIFL